MAIGKDAAADRGTDTDVAVMMTRMQQQLAVLDRKLDTLISRSSERPYETKPYPNTFQRFDQARRQEEPRQNGAFNQRTLHKAVCADCRKECEVPFKPTGDRPVYCKECFSKRRSSAAAFKPHAQAKVVPVAHAQKEHLDKAHKAPAAKKTADKKRPAAKKKKK
jgi:CxxC-x17-CxxC domain-containing protein